MSSIKLTRSRFYISKENFDKARDSALSGEEISWKINANQNSFNILERPTPFVSVKSILEAFGFQTYSSDEAIWVSDFEDKDMSQFEWRSMVYALIQLSKFENGSFIELEVEGKNGRFCIEDGNFVEYGIGKISNFRNVKVGKTPFHPIDNT